MVTNTVLCDSNKIAYPIQVLICRIAWYVYDAKIKEFQQTQKETNALVDWNKDQHVPSAMHHNFVHHRYSVCLVFLNQFGQFNCNQ